MKQPGSTAKDGTVVLHVHMAQPAARQLLDQITR